MRSAATNRRQVESKAIAICVDYVAPRERESGKRRFDLVRATIAVLGFHLLLRTLILLRQLNY